jgi:hypothetical protein
MLYRFSATWFELSCLICYFAATWQSQINWKMTTFRVIVHRFINFVRGILHMFIKFVMSMLIMWGHSNEDRELADHVHVWFILHRFKLAGDRGHVGNRRASVAQTCWRLKTSSNMVLRELGSGSRGAAGGWRSERGGRLQHVLFAWNYIVHASSFYFDQELLQYRLHESYSYNISNYYFIVSWNYIFLLFSLRFLYLLSHR